MLLQHHDIEEHHGTLPDMAVFELSVELPTTLPMEPAEVSYISQTFIDAPKPVKLILILVKTNFQLHFHTGG